GEAGAVGDGCVGMVVACVVPQPPSRPGIKKSRRYPASLGWPGKNLLLTRSASVFLKIARTSLDSFRRVRGRTASSTIYTPKVTFPKRKRASSPFRQIFDPIGTFCSFFSGSFYLPSCYALCMASIKILATSGRENSGGG